MALGIGPIGRLHTKMLYSDICNASFWDEKIKLSNEALEEFNFLETLLLTVSPNVAVITYSDASATGWGDFS